MKILCSGNPRQQTVASAVYRLYPDADFASRATGYDLRFWDRGSEQYFKDQIVKYNVFINSSYICNGGQQALLETTYNEWTKAKICGHIVNIGSTAEWLGVDSVFGAYSIHKRALRDRSLQLNSRDIKTTHIIAGGLNDGKPGHESWLDLTYVADAIKWAITHPCQIPLIEIH